MTKEIWLTLKLLIDIAMSGIADVTKAMTFVKEGGRSETEIYLAGLRRMATIAILLPTPILVLGAIGQFSLFIAIAGMLWVIATAILLILATPIALLLGLVAGKGKHSGEWYVNLILTILLVELGITAFTAIVPIRNNPGAIPLLLVLAMILGIFAVKGTASIFTKKLLAAVVTTQFLLLTTSLFLPGSFKEAAKIPRSIDKTVAGMIACTQEENKDKLECKKNFQPQEQSKTSESAKTIEIVVIAEPGKWSENISIPPHYGFRLRSEKDFCIKRWDGREQCGPERKWLGDELRNAVFRVKAKGTESVEVLVILYPL